MLVVHAKFVGVVGAGERQVISDGRKDVVIPRFSPAIDPEDASRSPSYPTPPADLRNEAQLVVSWKYLGNRIVQSIAREHVRHAGSGNKPLGIVAHAHVAFIDQVRGECVCPPY